MHQHTVQWGTRFGGPAICHCQSNLVTPLSYKRAAQMVTSCMTPECGSPYPTRPVLQSTCDLKKSPVLVRYTAARTCLQEVSNCGALTVSQTCHNKDQVTPELGPQAGLWLCWGLQPLHQLAPAIDHLGQPFCLSLQLSWCTPVVPSAMLGGSLVAAATRAWIMRWFSVPTASSPTASPASALWNIATHVLPSIP